MSVYMPKINYILLIYRNLFLSPTYTSKLLLLNSLIEFLGAKTDIHFNFTLIYPYLQKFSRLTKKKTAVFHGNQSA